MCGCACYLCFCRVFARKVFIFLSLFAKDSRKTNKQSNNKQKRKKNTQKNEMQSAANREGCYNSRDVYFQCVSQKGVESCKDELAVYSDKCPKSWKDFFDRQQERQMVLEGQASMARARRTQASSQQQQ